MAETTCPVTTLEELDALDGDECRAGYFSAREGDPEPGNNRSRAYWHGWRCGMMDRGLMPIPPEHRELVRQVVARNRKQWRRADG